MAGIGWKLQRMIDHGSLAGTIAAYLTGVAVTSAPWLLTTAVLTSLRLVSRHATGDFAGVERFLTVVYAVTVVLSAPVHVVVSRYTADRLYDHHVERIAAPLRRAAALTVTGFALIGIVLVGALRMPLALALVGAPLTAVIGAQWLMLSVGGGMMSPVVLLRAFGVGAPMSLIGALVVERAAPAAGGAGYLFGFAIGQVFTLALLVRGVARALPAATDESARVWPAFIEYRLLAWSAFAYYVSIWADKIVVYVIKGADAAAFYAAIAAVAWFSVIPAFAWIYVQVETAFYQRFRSFYAELEAGASLRELKQYAERISDEAKRILRGAVAVQVGATTLVIAAAPRIVHAVGLSPDAGPLFRLAAMGAGLQVFALLEVLLLTYFDLRRDAFVICTCLLVGVTALTSICAAIGWPPVVGHLVACAITALLGLGLVRRRLQTLVLDTFQSQPFGVA
ncbi:MAG TPA: exopolysaccharide Pel transporter PelG [Polyangia bacterium]|nr:exopolysaccharide Pel transporter PelG [Polyangia bacterium]